MPLSRYMQAVCGQQLWSTPPQQPLLFFRLFLLAITVRRDLHLLTPWLFFLCLLISALVLVIRAFALLLLLITLIVCH